MTGNNAIDCSRTAKFTEELGLNFDSVLEKLLNARIGIKISSEYLTTGNGQVTLEFLVDILARIFTEIIIEIEDLDINDHQALHMFLSRVKQINSNVLLDNIETCKVKLLIGPSEKKYDYNFYISSNGWEAYISPECTAEPVTNSLYNPIGAAMAAAMGAAEVFKFILKDDLNKAGNKINFRTINFSCYSYLMNGYNLENPDLPDILDIGDVKMIGAGAVGMAFVSVIKHMKLTGAITVVDNDLVDNSNLDRYLGVYQEDLGKYKTYIVRDTLSHIVGLKVSCFSGKYQSFVETLGRFMDIVICSVDNDDTRQELQSDLPRLILNGATGGSTFSISRHDFINNACLGCLYPVDKEKIKNEEKFAKILGVPVGNFTYKYENNIILNESEIQNIKQYINIPDRLLNDHKGITLRDLLGDREVCGRFKLPSVGIAGAVGFVSAMPGILLAGELIKERYFKSNVLNNAFHANALYGPSKNSVILRSKVNKRECSCYCSDSIMIKLFKDKYSIEKDGIV